MAWQYIEFINGLSPYICQTEKEFERMKKLYVLKQINENKWLATHQIVYFVIGISSKNESSFLGQYHTVHAAKTQIGKRNKTEGFVKVNIYKKPEDLNVGFYCITDKDVDDKNLIYSCEPN